MDEVELIKRKKLQELMKKATQPKVEYPSAPLHIDENSLQEVINKYPLVLVDFYADWCMPCKMIAPILEELASELKGKLVIAKINVDENPRAAMEYQAMSIPTLIIFKNGKPVDRIVGALPKPVLLSRLKAFL